MSWLVHKSESFPIVGEKQEKNKTHCHIAKLKLDLLIFKKWINYEHNLVINLIKEICEKCIHLVFS